MSIRAVIAAMGFALSAGLMMSCEPFEMLPEEESAARPEGKLGEIERGDSYDEVVAALGRPDGRVRGWWEGPVEFSMAYTVLYYRGVGRVVIDEERTVHAVEADAAEDGRSDTN